MGIVLISTTAFLRFFRQFVLLFVLTQVIPDIYTTNMTLLNIQNDELLLDWRCRGLFRYHLRRNTVRKVGGAGTKLPNIMLDLCVETSYIKSFVSLNSGELDSCYAVSLSS